ncbi:unnamed protein product [Mucor hiemalis]
MNTTAELILKYQEQNAEITRTNARLNERIAILENVIYELQQDNFQLRIANAVKQRIKKKGIVRKKSNITTISEKRKGDTAIEKQPTTPLPPQPPQPPLLQQELKQEQEESSKTTTTKKRSCSSKPINYILPSTRCKLRKGDPFTFGND